MDHRTSEEKKELEEWFANLQVGDEMAIKTYRWGRRYYWTISKVVKITPSGRRNLENGMVVMPDKSIRGDSNSSVSPVTDEIKKAIWRINTVVYIGNNLDIDKLSNDNLERVLEIMKKNEEEMGK